VITCWGTQVTSLQSVDTNERALHSYIQRADVQKESPSHEKVIAVVNNAVFWYRLRDLLRILKPIHDVQKLSESDRSSLGGMAERWKKILEEWEFHQKSMPHTDWSHLKEVYHSRHKIQSSPESYNAWCLDPRTRIPTAPYDPDNVADFMQHHGIIQAGQVHALQTQLLQFRRGEGIFRLPTTAEDPIDDPYFYWLRIGALDPACLLVAPALRLFLCLSNSVPSSVPSATRTAYKIS
jgi:hypothetical protein